MPIAAQKLSLAAAALATFSLERPCACKDHDRSMFLSKFRPARKFFKRCVAVARLLFFLLRSDPCRRISHSSRTVCFYSLQCRLTSSIINCLELLQPQPFCSSCFTFAPVPAFLAKFYFDSN